MKVRFDGWVEQVEVLESSQPEFAEAARTAGAFWQFKRWSLTSGNPITVEVIAPMIFTLDFEAVSADEKIALASKTCGDLGKEIINHRNEDPTRSLRPVPSFIATRKLIRAGESNSDAFDNAGLLSRVELGERFELALPLLTKRCIESPQSAYADFLPGDVRRLLY
ncbi:hypothetical protein NVV94_00945 [Pseudomonas sp. LS1212]|uniref:hypothetical protein n=1 Tax=Pseudomonas sp. LS1212 TaxID=2972478 RepID=UPI00215CB216|nr:hypothetical protein [Pseudomonas sp. LS1212]UVJ44216.1 hypothetical protein NVV94_00945 [Pseudomonas sp. LS1212]